MTPSNRNRTVALAALLQCAELVRQIAWDGRPDPDAFETAINSILALDAADVDGVYGGLDKLKLGLETLQTQLVGERQRKIELTRYAIGLLYLERRLAKRPNMVAAVRKGITTAQQQLEFFGTTHDNIIARLADTYQQTISQIGPRIIVHGEQSHLSNADNAARIRALLLAGIRAAVLWRQAGGTRWRLLFQRRKLLHEASSLLAML